MGDAKFDHLLARLPRIGVKSDIGPYAAPGLAVSEHFAVTKSLEGEGWRLTHRPSGHKFSEALAADPEILTWLAGELEGAADGWDETDPFALVAKVDEGVRLRFPGGVESLGRLDLLEVAP